jgi:hypothetical protein
VCILSFLEEEKMKCLAMTALVMVFMVNTGVFANTVQFGMFSGDFMDPSLWWDPTTGTNHVPTSSDLALFFTCTPVFVGASDAATISDLYLGEWCRGGTNLPHNSVQTMRMWGSLTVLHTTNIGCLSDGSPTERGEVTIENGGNFTVNEWIFLGKGNNGTITMNAGNLYAGWGISMGCDPWSSGSGVGTIYMNGGSLSCNQLIYESDASKIVMSGGTVGIWQYNQGLAAINSGHIVAAAGKSLQYTTYAAPFGLTGIQITVVPEPATMAILGLGGLFLARRRS